MTHPRYVVGKKLYEAKDNGGVIVVTEYEIVHAKKRYQLFPQFYSATGAHTPTEIDLGRLRDTPDEALARFKQVLEDRIESARTSLEMCIEYNDLMKDAEVKNISVDHVRAKHDEMMQQHKANLKSREEA